ncbi:ROK family protein [Amycolatopsis albispora]|uniref:ROK family protein n=1 Tax=Amycolatopsis albispora TaxID=1804986 RepID=UPI001F1BF854|nr:ROK family protein [Amycolatopsis albispora]
MRWAPFRDIRDDLAQLAAAVAEFGEPEAIGVAVPATLDHTGTVLTWPNRPGWAGANLYTLFDEIFPSVPVGFADDGDLAAVAEADAAGCADLVYFGVGTGIGGGIVSGGRPWPGLARGSCELGHLVVDRNGPLCTCGRSGCVQALASGPATLRRAAGILGREPEFAEFTQAYRDAAGWALAAVQETCAALATAAVGIAELAHPDRVVIGGGFAAALPGFAAEVAAQAKTLARAGKPPVPIQPANLGGLSSLHGALLLAANQHWGKH